MRLFLGCLVSSIAVLPALTGCGNAVGCDFRADSVNGPEDRCQERSGLSASSFSGACEALQGEVLDGGCPREDAVAECSLGLQGDGTEVIDVYYAPMPVDEAESACGDDEFTAL